jgi:hypothetical protein
MAVVDMSRANRESAVRIKYTSANGQSATQLLCIAQFS